MRFIHEHRAVWPIVMRCCVREAIRAAYYKAIHRTESETQVQQRTIVQEIRRIHALPKRDHDGSPRTHRELVKAGIDCAEKTVAKRMRRAGIRAKSARKFRLVSTDSKYGLPVAPNRLDQDFEVKSINQFWLSGFTYIPHRAGVSYLSTIQDLCSRKIVGWAVGTRIDAEMAMRALQQAIDLSPPHASPIANGLNWIENWSRPTTFRSRPKPHEGLGREHLSMDELAEYPAVGIVAESNLAACVTIEKILDEGSSKNTPDHVIPGSARTWWNAADHEPVEVRGYWTLEDVNHAQHVVFCGMQR